MSLYQNLATAVQEELQSNGVLDSSGNEVLKFSATASAVNELTITNAATGGMPKISATGGDTNITIEIAGKGTGGLLIGDDMPLIFGDDSDATIKYDETTNNRLEITCSNGIALSDTVEMTSPRITTGINDANGNEAIKLTATGSAVNEITVANAAAGNAPAISATGDDTDIDLQVSPKGTGSIVLGGPIAWASGEINTETLSDNKTIAAGDPQVQFLDPGGSGRTVTLPAEASSTGRLYFIVNTADAAEDLTVKDDAANTIVTISQDEAGLVVCDGTSWKGFVGANT